MGTDENFLSRWSRRKHAANAGRPPAEVATPAAPMPAAAPAVSAAAAAPPVGSAVVPEAPGREPPPPVESLTPDSDFSRFMASDVDGDVRRKALKTLFSDPRFNVMDMMDVYVDDYSKPDPLPESWLEKLEQMSRLGDRAGRDREEEARRQAERVAAEGASAPPPEATADAARTPAPSPEGTEAGREGSPADGHMGDGIAAGRADTPASEGNPP